MSILEFGGQNGTRLTNWALSDRLAELMPTLDEPQLASTAASLHATLTGLIADAMASPRPIGGAELESIVRSLLPALTDADLILLLLEPHSDPAVDSAISARARLLLAEASTCMQEATLDAVTARLSAGERNGGRLLSEGFARALADAVHAGTRPEPSQGLVERKRVTEAYDERALLEAAQNGDPESVAAILARCSGLPVAAIHHAAEIRSAKTLVSLVWKSGFTMRAGTAVQLLLGELAPSQLLNPGPTGGYPLSREEMEWHIELITWRRAA